MASDLLANSWAKFYWAQKHLESVDGALARTLDPNIHEVSLKTDVQTDGSHATVLTRVAKLPLIRRDLGLAIGDALQNFRAALDYLAWDLVAIGSAPKFNPRQVQFPMHSSWADMKDWLDRRLPGVPPEHRAIIRRYQPYRRGDGPKAIRWLRNLSDKDKHRILIPAVLNVREFHPRITSEWPLVGYRNLLRHSCALNVGTEVLHLELVRGPASGDCHVDVEGDIALYPSLGRGVPVADALGLIRWTVLEILTTFDDLL